MAIERSLYGMPEGEGGLENVGDIGVADVLEIEIDMPEITEMDDGSVEITLVSDTISC